MALCIWTVQKKLRLLDLRGCKIGDAGLAHLSDMTSLASIKLRSTSVTDAGLAHLDKLKSLRSLALEDASAQTPDLCTSKA